MRIVTGFLETVMADNMDWNAFMLQSPNLSGTHLPISTTLILRPSLPIQWVFSRFIQSILVKGEFDR
jgi:hypothetical protein